MSLLTHAKTELAAAARALEELQRSTRLDQMDAHWKTFIRHLERCWFKAEAELKKLPKWQGWTERGRTESLRSGDDPLLAYLRYARGAEEHGIDAIAAPKLGGFSIGPITPGAGILLDEVRFDGKTLSVKSDYPIQVLIDP